VNVRAALSAEIANQIESACDSLRAFRGEISVGAPRRALLSVYYAVIHQVTAALSTKGLHPRTHEGAINLFSLHFLKPGVFSRDSVKKLAKLVTERQTADYSVNIPIDMEDVVAAHALACQLILEAFSYFATLDRIKPKMTALRKDFLAFRRTFAKSRKSPSNGTP